jgi:beta-glucanase (GH16 family)
MYRYSQLLLLLLAMIRIGPTIAGWKLTFNDEFTQQSNLNSSKWNTFYHWGPAVIINQEAQFYSPNSFSFCDNFVSLVGQKASAFGQAYTSGVMTTQHKFSQLYGYFEIKARMPIGKGLWPAFWMLPQNAPGGSLSTEMDILEILSGNPNTIYLTYHHNATTNPQAVYIGSEMSDGQFHTYGFEWNPSIMIWYIDGVARFNVTHDIPNVPCYILLNLAIGGPWGGLPNATTPWPSSMDVSYVRAFQYVSSGGYYVKGPGAGISYPSAAAVEASNAYVSSASAYPYYILSTTQNATSGVAGSTVAITLKFYTGSTISHTYISLTPMNATGTLLYSAAASIEINSQPGSILTKTFNIKIPSAWSPGYYWITAGFFNNTWSSNTLWAGSIAAYGVTASAASVIKYPVGSGSQDNAICTATANLIGNDDISVAPLTSLSGDSSAVSPSSSSSSSASADTTPSSMASTVHPSIIVLVLLVAYFASL